MPPRSSNYRGQTDSMEVLNVNFTLPAAVAASQTIGLLDDLLEGARRTHGGGHAEALTLEELFLEVTR